MGRREHGPMFKDGNQEIALGVESAWPAAVTAQTGMVWISEPDGHAGSGLAVAEPSTDTSIAVIAA
jgi:hypothetical protein